MKYLIDYTKECTTGVLEKNGAFFCFSKEQFDEHAKENVEYVSLEAGLVCPKENAKALRDELEQCIDKAIAQDLEENGKEKIIERELRNHECGYTGDISAAVSALEIYEDITEKDIAEKHWHLMQTDDDY